jgi:C_GCAxxG_C_C family probable redox protein
MTSKSDLASEKFDAGYNCAQAVLFAFCGELGLDKDLALKVTTGLGGGMGHMQEVCGAVTGGILALGAKHGRADGAPRAATELTYAKTRELITRFKDLHGTCLCGELLPNCDLNTPAGQQKFKEQNLRNTVCMHCVRDAVRIVEELA